MPTVYLAPGPFGAGGQFFTTTGLPLNAGLIYTYAASTTTPTATYTTSAGNVLNANPIQLSLDGRLGEIWLVMGTAYRIDIKDSLGNLLGTFDNLSGINDPSAFLSGNFTFSGNITFSGTNVFSGSNTVTGALAVVDSGFTIYDDVDSTKRFKFQSSGISTLTTRTITAPNADLTLPIVAAKGDIPAGTAAGVLGVITAGTDGRIIQADSTQTTGLVYRDKIVSAGVVVSTSGTSIDFTGIPAWVKRITIALQGVSTNGTSNYLVQIGPTAGVETTTYVSVGSILNSASLSTGAAVTTGFSLGNGFTAAANSHGTVTMILMDSSTNTWNYTSSVARSDGAINTGAGGKALAGALARIRITTVGGTDTFDAGSINVLYE